MEDPASGPGGAAARPFRAAQFGKKPSPFRQQVNSGSRPLQLLGASFLRGFETRTNLLWCDSAYAGLLRASSRVRSVYDGPCGLACRRSHPRTRCYLPDHRGSIFPTSERARGEYAAGVDVPQVAEEKLAEAGEGRGLLGGGRTFGSEGR